MINCINGRGRLKATWSPEQIARVPFANCRRPAGGRSIVESIKKYLVNGSLKVLRRKGKSHEAKETRGKYSKGKSIRKRDKSVYSRQEAGHREADTAVSGQGKSKACFAALAEAQNTVLHCREDTGPKKPRQWKPLLLLHCLRFPCAAGQDHYLRPGCGVRQLAPYGRTVALRGLLYRPVLRLAERQH